SEEKIPLLSGAVRSHSRNGVALAFDDIHRNNFFFLLIDEAGNYREYSRTLGTNQNGKILNQHIMFRDGRDFHPNPRRCAPLEKAIATCQSWPVHTHAKQCFFAFGRR
ncbi:MAG: hypothetical protein ACKPAC_06110, partial [Alphaproteobacteria bacterium]